MWEIDLVMLAEPASWRDPDSVTEAERKEWAIQVSAEAERCANVMENQPLWADF